VGKKLGRGLNLGTNPIGHWVLATEGKCLLHSVRPTFHSWYLGVTHALRYTVSPTFKFVHHSIGGLGVATFCSMLIPSMFEKLDIFLLWGDAIIRL